MARRRGARSGAVRPGRRAPGCRGEGPRRAAPRFCLAPRHAPPGSPRAPGAARAGPLLPRAGGTRPRPRAQLLARAWGRRRRKRRGGAEGKAKRARSGRRGCEEERCCCAAAGFSAALLLLLLLPPSAGQRLTGRTALRCRCDARCCYCWRRPLSAAALHVPRLGGSPGSSSSDGGGCCRGRSDGSTLRAAQPRSSFLPCRLCSCSPGRPHPARSFRPRPSPRPLPALDARGHLFAASVRDSPERESPQRLPGGAGRLNPCDASQPGVGLRAPPAECLARPEWIPSPPPHSGLEPLSQRGSAHSLASTFSVAPPPARSPRRVAPPPASFCTPGVAPPPALILLGAGVRLSPSGLFCLRFLAGLWAKETGTFL